MSLIKCLKKLKLDAHEAALIKSDTQDLTLDGLAAKEAAIQAINDRIKEYNTERQSILTQLEDQGANLSGIQVEEITDETAIQELLSKYAVQPTEPREIGQRDTDFSTISGEQAREGFVSATVARSSEGQLLTIHRGAPSPLIAEHFHFDALGKASGKAASGMGVFLTTDAGLAEAHGTREEFHLDIRNPATYDVKTLPEFDTKQEYFDFRQNLKAQGFDSIAIDLKKEGGGFVYIAFDPHQVIATPKEYFQPVYHGTPHKFSKFSLEAIGSGEGAQAYGWGLYFASNKDVAEWYRDTLSAGIMTKLPDGTMRVPEEYFFKGKPILELYDNATNKQEYYKAEIFERILLHSTPNQLKNYFSADEYGKDSDAYKFAHSIKESDITGKIDDKSVDLEFDLGNIYQVDIPSDETLLDWDKPINEQPKAIKDALNTIREQVKKSFPDYAYKDDITGHGLYQMYRDHRGGTSQFASEGFNEAGIKGIKYLDGTSRGTGGDRYNYVIFDENVVTIEAVNDEIVQATELFQQKRGSIQFGDQKTIINLFKSKNLSTFLHESGHLFLDVMQDISSRPEATPELKTEWAKVEAFLGVEAGAKLTTEQHEKWATSFESYLKEGKAPSAELRSAFQTFRGWLLDVYKAVKRFVGDEHLNDEIRGIFDRMLATDEQLQAAQSDGYEAIYKSAEEMGFTDKEFSDYKAVEKEVHERAQEDLDVEAIKEVQRERKEEWKNAKAKVQTEVELEVNQRKDVRAKHFLMTGEFLPGDPMAEIITSPVKIDKNELKAMYEGTDFMSELRRLPVGKSQITAVEGGLHPDVVAEMLGYKSGDSLIKAILEAGNRKQTIKTEVDVRMSDEYGDIRTDLDRVSEMAIDALHSDKRAHFLMLELKALNKRTGTGKTQSSVLKDVAYRLIDESGVPEAARVERFLADERKNGRKAEQAILDEDFNAARDAKRQQILSHYLYMAARDAKAEQAKFLRYFKKFSSKAVRKKLRGEHLLQIDAVMDQYSFKKIPLIKVEDRKALREWYDGRILDDTLPNIPTKMLDDAKSVNYKELAMSEFRGLYDAIKSMEAIAKEENTIKAGKEFYEKEEAIFQLIESAKEHNKQKKPPSIGAHLREQERGAAYILQKGDAELMRIEQMVAWLDGDKVDGPWRKFIWNLIADAEHARNDLDAEYTAKFIEILESIPKEESKRLREKVSVESLQIDLARADLIGMALHFGTESNFNKLVRGYQQLEGTEYLPQGVTVTEASMKAAINDNLSESDWLIVKKFWEMLDDKSEGSLFDKLNKLEIELNATPLKEVKGWKVETPFGTIDGGYVPLNYDPEMSARAEKHDTEQISPSGMRPSTRVGSVHERVEGYAAPINTDLFTLPQHISALTHDVTHRRAVRDVGKLLNDKRIRLVIKTSLGEPYRQQFNAWLAHVTDDKNIDRTGAKMWLSWMKRLRMNTSFAYMGFKWTTVVQQPVGLTQSMDVMRKMKGARSMMFKEVKNYATNFKQMRKFVFTMSGEMRHRASTLDRDLRDNLKRELGKNDWHSKMIRTGYIGIAEADMIVSIPTWIASYKWAIKEGYSEKQAIDWADSRVRMSQGSGSAKDLASIQRGNELLKWITMFYGYFSMYYQRIRDTGRSTKHLKDVPEAMMRHWWITVSTVVLAEVFSGRGPEEDEEWGDWAAKKAAFYPLMSIPFARDAANAIESGYSYDVTPVGAAGKSLVNMIGDTTDLITGEGEIDDLIKSTVKTSGYFLGAPAGQIDITAGHIFRAIEGDTDFNPYYLFYREPKE